jgi:hypothetical protein
MTLVDRLFRRGGPPQVDLSGLQVRLPAGVAWWSGRPADPDLVRARLADGCRDAGVDPPTPEEFDTRAAGLDDEAWNRLGALAFALDLQDVRAALSAGAVARPPLEILDAGFVGVARRTPLLTLELLGRSALRVEELARRLLAGLGAAVRGESPRASRERLERLDYERLLAEAERAKQSATDRIEELQRLQDQEEENRPRRGKW